jgi:hypothetical protein
VTQYGRFQRGEAAALAALALFLVALNLTPITNNDLFLHLKTGDIVLKTGKVPHVDDYSALARGRPFIAHEWLAGVVFRLVQIAGGWRGLILLKPLSALVTAAILYGAARCSGALPATSIPALAFVMTLGAARFVERPHIFTYIMMAAFLLLLARRKAGLSAPGWMFLALQMVWANLHGGFILGPLIVGLAATGAAIDRLTEPSVAGRPAASATARTGETKGLALLAAGLVAASLLNPYGWRLLRLPFDLTSSSFMEEIYEWLPPLLYTDPSTGSWALSPFARTYMARYYVVWALFGLVVHGLAIARWRRDRTAAPPGGSFPALLYAAFLALSLRMNRNVTDFALATLPGVASTLTASIAPRPPDEIVDRRPRTLYAIAIGLLALAAFFVVRGYPYSPSLSREFGFGIGRTVPVGGAAYLERIGMRGNVFNTYASGAYLIDRLYPKVRVAMDSRNDVYGEELYRTYNRALVDFDALEALLGRLDAGAVLLDWPNQGMMTAAATVHRLKHWVPVYFDDLSVVYLRDDGPWGQIAARDAYSLLDPALYRGAATRPENAARSLEEAERALSVRRSYIARVMRIDALFGLGRDAEAVSEETRILAENPPLFHIYTHLGWIRLGRGDRKEASERFLRALRFKPDSAVARQGLSLARGSASP